MNFNATLIGQSITFLVFVWFCMKYVWPPIMHALDARKKQIADGLAAGERGKHEQELAQKRAAEIGQEVNRAKEGLRAQVVSIALAGASKVLEREVDANTHNDLLNKLAAQI